MMELRIKSRRRKQNADFVFVTNNRVMVASAKKCFLEFPTIVNKLEESGITYNNTPLEYARMDNKFARSQLGIGYSSNLAQLAMTYYWTDPTRELYDNFIILSVVAQVLIDGCKREYEVDGMTETERIANLPCMNIWEQDFPEFMKYTRKVSYTKNGKPRPYDEIKKDKERLSSRINTQLVCPMNYLSNILGSLKRMNYKYSIPTKNFFIKDSGKANDRQMSKIRKYVDEASYQIYLISHSPIDLEIRADLITQIFDDIIEKISTMKINNNKTINRLIETALGIESEFNKNRTAKKEYYKRNLLLLKILYRMSPEKFLSNFTEVSKKAA